LTNPFVPSAFSQSAVVPREASINVTAIVSAWVQYGVNYGFIVGTPSPTELYGFPTASNACLTKFATPSLQLVYF